MGSNLNWKKEDIPLEVQKRMVVSEIIGKKKNKLNAQRVREDGYTFDSKKEYRYFKNLQLLQKAGEIKYFLCQIPFRLCGGVKYFTDFMICDKNGEIRYVDVKGFFTSQSKNKIKITESLYPVKIIIEK